MVSTGYFMVDFPIIENQMESFMETLIKYLPRLSVITPFPEVLKTATASRGRLAEMSYTVPLILTVWAMTHCTKKLASNRNKQYVSCSLFLKQLY
jgi:hypothetical protein